MQVVWEKSEINLKGIPSELIIKDRIQKANYLSVGWCGQGWRGGLQISNFQGWRLKCHERLVCLICELFLNMPCLSVQFHLTDELEKSCDGEKVK